MKKDNTFQFFFLLITFLAVATLFGSCRYLPQTAMLFVTPTVLIAAFFGIMAIAHKDQKKLLAIEAKALEKRASFETKRVEEAKEKKVRAAKKSPVVKMFRKVKKKKDANKIRV